MTGFVVLFIIVAGSSLLGAVASASGSTAGSISTIRRRLSSVSHPRHRRLADLGQRRVDRSRRRRSRRPGELNSARSSTRRRFEVRSPARPSTRRAARAAERRTAGVSGRGRVVPEPAVAREHREAPALGLHQARNGPHPARRPVRAIAPATQPPRRELGRLVRTDHHVDVGIARRPRVGRARQRRPRPRSVTASMPAASRSNAARSGPFQRRRRRTGTRRSSAGRRDGSSTRSARRCPIARCGSPPASASAVRERDDVEPRGSPSGRAGRAAARNSSPNGWWWPYSSPSVAITTSGGSSSGSDPRRQPRLDHVPREAVGVGGRLRLERDRAPTGRRRRSATDDDCGHRRHRPGTAAACRARLGGLPRGEDGVA